MARIRKIVENICFTITIILAIPIVALAFVIMLIGSLFAPE
jgi:hypothetical protein